MELPALFLKRMELLTGGSFAAQYEAPQARGLRINTLEGLGGRTAALPAAFRRAGAVLPGRICRTRDVSCGK